jgi:hypothetical protein
MSVLRLGTETRRDVARTDTATAVSLSEGAEVDDMYYPRSATGLQAITYPVGPTVLGLGLTADGSANTKGAYAELIASAPFEANAILFNVMSTIATAGRLFLIDIATGAAASETVVVPNVIVEGTSSISSSYGHGWIRIPLKIAAGQRIAIRCQCSTGGEAIVQVAVTLIAAGGVPGFTSVVNYGADASDSGGTRLDPGGTANTKASSWTEITPSTSDIIQWLSLLTTYGHTTVASCSWSIDIATGAGGAEVVLIPDLRLTSATNTGSTPSLQPKAQEMLTYIPAGTRISARCSCSINTATSRLIDVALLAGKAA